MRRVAAVTPVLASAVALAVVALAVAPAGARDERPRYSWHRVAVGTELVFKSVAEIGGAPFESGLRYTLLGRDAKAARVKVETLDASGAVMHTQEQEVPVDSATAALAPGIEEMERRPREEVVVDAGAFACEYRRYRRKEEPGLDIEVWLHQDLPMPVKTVWKSGGTTGSLELVSVRRK